MQPAKTLIFSILYSAVLWFSAYAAPYAKGTNALPQKFEIPSYSMPDESQHQLSLNLNKRIHGLSLLRTKFAPQNYFSQSYSMPEITRQLQQQQQRINKRVHHLSLLRMGKLFKTNTTPEVKRLSSDSLWRYLASTSSYSPSGMK